MIRERALGLIAHARGLLPRDVRAVRYFEPAMRMATVERGLTLPTLAYVRHHGLTIKAGPFAGLRIPPATALQVPGLAGRLGGSYEAELRPAIEALLASEPELVVNIGSADGLYSVGMAIRCPRAQVIAFEADAYAAEVSRELARANGVGARIEQRGSCAVESLASIAAPAATVVICDCEGAERELIDPERVPWLRSAAILIEVHEPFSPGLGELLRRRLEPSHELETIEPQRHYLAEHTLFTEVPGVSPVQQESLMSEVRPWRTPWLLAMPR